MENSMVLSNDLDGIEEMESLEDELESLGENSDSYIGRFEEDIHSKLKIKSDVTVTLKRIKIDDIIVSNFKKVSREKTLIGLTGVIGEFGVVSPIHVLKLEDEDSYMLLDGLRRLFGAVRNGHKEINAMVWDFSDKQEGKQMANVLSLLINRSQAFSVQEMWEQLQILEEVNGLSPGLIEYLLQMNSGDVMKLKDIMLSDTEYSDIRSDLMLGILNIETAYKRLCNARRRENRLQKEDNLVIEGSDVSLDSVDDVQKLGVEDVKELLDLTTIDITDTSLEELDRSAEVRGEPVVQDPKNRKPVDPAIKQAVFARDGFKCRCCGLDGTRWLVLAYHHIIPVFLGGPDTVENGATVCANCHMSIHHYSFGKLNVDLDKLDEKEKQTFKNIFKFGNVIIEAMKRAGIDRETAYREDSGSRRHPHPSEGLSYKAILDSTQKGVSV